MFFRARDTCCRKAFCFTTRTRSTMTKIQGIIGANPNNIWNISGVAYDAQLYAYRVFGCAGSVTDDSLYFLPVYL